MSDIFYNAGYNAAEWSVTIPRTNNGTATGLISNTITAFYGNDSSTGLGENIYACELTLEGNKRVDDKSSSPTAPEPIPSIII